LVFRVFRALDLLDQLMLELDGYRLAGWLSLAITLGTGTSARGPLRDGC